MKQLSIWILVVLTQIVIKSYSSNNSNMEMEDLVIGHQILIPCNERDEQLFDLPLLKSGMPAMNHHRENCSWEDIHITLAAERLLKSGSASEPFAYQVTCLAMRASAKHAQWGNGWVKSVFDHQRRESQSRQGGNPPNNYISAQLDDLLNHVPNINLGIIKMGDLGALYQGLFRHFMYELLPSFADNACQLHDPATDANGNIEYDNNGDPILKHDRLFDDGIIPCFEEQESQGLISPLALSFAKFWVPRWASWLREYVYDKYCLI